MTAQRDIRGLTERRLRAPRNRNEARADPPDGFEQADEAQRSIYRTARKIAGRVLFGGVPTGVAVTAAQQHGGPWPASTQPQTTSVGYAAVQRFLRPVALQDAPVWALDL